MKKTFFRLLLIVSAVYLVLHLCLASSPVQKRVVEEVRKGLAEFGLDLKIESIEFSAFAPKIYLSRVELSSTPTAEIALPNPISIDKIKIEFQPMSLISRQIFIREVILFHPRIIVPGADRLVRQIEKMVVGKRRAEFKGGFFTVVLGKVEMVDALVQVVSKQPSFRIQSRSLGVSVRNNAVDQYGVGVETKNLEIERGRSRIGLTNVDIDVDLTQKSIRVNKALVQGSELSIQMTGMSSFPNRSMVPRSLSVSYEVRLPLRLLNEIPELSFASLSGVLTSSGSVGLMKGLYSGSGNARYESIAVDGYKIGDGSFSYALKDRRVDLTGLSLRYAGGELTSKNVVIDLKERNPLKGNFGVKGVRLEEILESVNTSGVPVEMTIDGDMKVQGYLSQPFEIGSEIITKVADFLVWEGGGKPKTPVLSVKEGGVEGRLTFFKDRMDFRTQVNVLQGTSQVEGTLGFDNRAKLKVQSKGLSLTELKKISTLPLGGMANVTAEIDVVGSDAKVNGTFEVAGGEIADLSFGNIKGGAQYRNNLLTFENLETTRRGPTEGGEEALGGLLRGSGLVDFAPKSTHYRFQVEMKRVATDAAFGVFKKFSLPFSPPSGGEVSASISIEGGHDPHGVIVLGSGQMREFLWYREGWRSADFQVRYRTDGFDLTRAMLMKRSGGLEVRANLSDKASEFHFKSHGLKLEELDRLGQAPVASEVVGEIKIEKTAAKTKAVGDVKLIKTTFRGTVFPPSSITLRSDNDGIEMLGNLMGDRFRGRLARENKAGKPWELLLYFNQFDFAPAVSGWLGQDIPTISELLATGDISLTWDPNDPRSMKGAGMVSLLNLGLKGTPLTNQKPLEIQINGGNLKVNRFQLVGQDGQISLEILFEQDRILVASFDGKLDLQYLQPFIPGLDYGSGKVSAGLRFSGRPPRLGLLGNVSLEDGTLRLKGMEDEFRKSQIKLTLSQDRINVDQFSATVNGGNVAISGDLKFDKRKALIPNLTINASKVTLKTRDFLTTRFSGDFTLTGEDFPYALKGRCRIFESVLTKLEFAPSPPKAKSTPTLAFDIVCEAKDHLLVKADTLDAEFKGVLHLKGTSDEVGMLGSAEVMRGSLLFREKRFQLNTGTVRFESPAQLAPRFTISGQTMVKESKTVAPQEYEVNLMVYGTPADYKIRLTSNPVLAESDIISLLLLGVTGRGEEGNYVDLGTTLVGQIPLQSRLQSELGVDIKVKTQTGKGVELAKPSSGSVGSTSDVTVPVVQIQKDITKRTKVSYSNTLEAIPVREFKLEQRLGDRFTGNFSVVDRSRTETETQSIQSYGLDLRYRFQFE